MDPIFKGVLVFVNLFLVFLLGYYLWGLNLFGSLTNEDAVINLFLTISILIGLVNIFDAFLNKAVMAGKGTLLLILLAIAIFIFEALVFL